MQDRTEETDIGSQQVTGKAAHAFLERDRCRNWDNKLSKGVVSEGVVSDRLGFCSKATPTAAFCITSPFNLG